MTTHPPGAAAPLMTPSWSAVAARGRAEWVMGAGGLRLRAALFPAENPIGAVVLNGGRTEFIEKYLEVIDELVGRGFTVLTHDWRGQGLSDRLDGDRLKGCADGFDDFITDFTILLNQFEDRLPKPWIALSHSMGGCLTLLALAKGERRFSAVMAFAPMLGLKAASGPMRPVTRALARRMVRVGRGRDYIGNRPVDPFTARFADNALTSDRARFERMQALIAAWPDLALGQVTWGWIDSALSAMAWLRKTREIERLSIPVVLFAAGREALVDNVAIEAFAKRLPEGRCERIPKSRHELLMETDDIRLIVWRAFDALAAPLI